MQKVVKLFFTIFPLNFLFSFWPLKFMLSEIIAKYSRLFLQTVRYVLWLSEDKSV